MNSVHVFEVRFRVRYLDDDRVGDEVRSDILWVCHERGVYFVNSVHVFEVRFRVRYLGDDRVGEEIRSDILSLNLTR